MGNQTDVNLNLEEGKQNNSVLRRFKDMLEGRHAGRKCLPTPAGLEPSTCSQSQDASGH